MSQLKAALRSLARKPGFSLAVIAMFALGIAANTAIFSIFDGLFLGSLPFHQPNQLLYLNEAAPRWNLTVTGISYADFVAWREQNHSFESVSVFNDSAQTLSGFGEAKRVRSATVSFDLANTLGIQPVIGRNFLPEEDRKGGRKVVLLGNALWQTKFNSSQDVIGKTLQLDNEPYEVIGVLPKTAVFPAEAELWIPLQEDPNNHSGWYLDGVGRLKAGVTRDQAIADLMRIHKGMVPKYPENDITFPTAIPLRDNYTGDYRLITQVLLGAVGLVLLIACVNVAGLMMARGTARAREVAIRAALGAGRRALIYQLLTESLLLAAFGGIVGIGLGWAGLRAMLSLMPDVLPAWIDFQIDYRFALFAVLVTAAAAVISGLGPALEFSKVDLRGFLADAGAKASLSRSRKRGMNILVIGEIALALMLLASAGLLVKAFRKVLDTDPGFRSQNVLTFSVSLPAAKYKKPESRLDFFTQYVERLRSAPGVEAASAGTLVPLGGHNGTFFQVEGAAPRSSKDQDPVILTVRTLPGYFHAMGIPLQAGRDFDDRDGVKDGPQSAIVNETFAKLNWPDADPIGKRVGYRGNKPTWMTVVGVARDTKHYGLDREVRPEVYTPIRMQGNETMTLAIHGSGDVRGLTATARDILRQMDADLAPAEMRTMEERINRSLWTRRTYSWLFGVFAGIALVMAIAGIYGVISYAVTQQTREIGIRMALGAEPGQVLSAILREGMTLAAIGLAIGLAGAFAATRLLQTLLAGVSPHDPWAFLAVSIVLIAAALAANLIPARRAARIDPMHALRFE
jgi:predicted permease